MFDNSVVLPTPLRHLNRPVREVQVPDFEHRAVFRHPRLHRFRQRRLVIGFDDFDLIGFRLCNSEVREVFPPNLIANLARIAAITGETERQQHDAGDT